MKSYRFSRVSLKSEHLLGILRDFYRAYSDTEFIGKSKAQYRHKYWNWYNYLFLCCSLLVSVHIIVFMLSKYFSFILNFDYNWLYTMFYQMKQGVKRTHTCVLYRRLSRQVHGLSNRCTFALANGLAGRFISRYWVSLIGFKLCPSRELVWHLSTQVNIGYLAV